MKKLLLGALLAGGLLTARAQQSVNQWSDGGTPWGSKFRQTDAQLPVERMPAFDLHALQIQDELNKDDKTLPYRFALPGWGQHFSQRRQHLTSGIASRARVGWGGRTPAVIAGSRPSGTAVLWHIMQLRR